MYGRNVNKTDILCKLKNEVDIRDVRFESKLGLIGPNVENLGLLKIIFSTFGANLAQFGLYQLLVLSSLLNHYRWYNQLEFQRRRKGKCLLRAAVHLPI